MHTLAVASRLLVAAMAAPTVPLDPSHYHPSDIIRRDVVVVGGGTTGTYAAIRLKDLNKSVVVVEKDYRMGGHENTYIDPSGIAIDYGVQSYYNTSVAWDFFARYNISIEPFVFQEDQTSFVDFSTGEVVPDFSPSYDFTAYSAQLDKYPYMSWGYGWIPEPVPEDLLLPFGDFVEKYGLEEQVYAIWWIVNGMSNLPLLEQVTMNVLKYFDRLYLNAINYGTLGTKPDMVTVNRNNGELFDRAHQELGENVLLNSAVVAGDRCSSDEEVRLAVSTPTGTKLIVASRLLITIPPLLSNMQSFGLDGNEEEIFGKFQHSGFYAGLVNATGLLQTGFTYRNVKPGAKYNLPDMPALYALMPSVVDGIWFYWYASPSEVPQESVEADVAGDIERLTGAPSSALSFPAFSSHSPFKLEVSAQDIEDGFYNDLRALQGQKNTWYSGAAVFAHNSGALWNYTHSLLPDVIAGL
ncbi:FAD/NAD(P)-binding domain-containing protein [Thozetella sp. PMI_491]|nr:FAD/NAD(P)-binding domain-containing protein [Thozetella sp. PMI_491]